MPDSTDRLDARHSSARLHVGAGRALINALGAAAVYFGVRELVEGSPQSATANAERIMRFERWLGIGFERSVQEFVLDHPTLVEAFNRAYVWLHWPFLIVALVVVFRRDRDAYSRLFGALVASGIIGLVVFATFPVSPPRFESGFVGTVSQAERQHFLPYPADWANRFASMPSFHAGWTLIAGLVLAKTVRSQFVRVMAFLPGPIVAVAVVATGNHYVLDVIVGSAIALGALMVTTWHPAEGMVSLRLHLHPVLLRRHADAP